MHVILYKETSLAGEIELFLMRESGTFPKNLVVDSVRHIALPSIRSVVEIVVIFKCIKLYSVTENLLFAQNFRYEGKFYFETAFLAVKSLLCRFGQ